MSEWDTDVSHDRLMFLMVLYWQDGISIFERTPVIQPAIAVYLPNKWRGEEATLQKIEL